MTIDTTNMCSHLRRKLFEEDVAELSKYYGSELWKQGIFPQTSNAEYYQKMVFGICSLTIVKFKRKSKNDSRLHCHRL